MPIKRLTFVLNTKTGKHTWSESQWGTRVPDAPVLSIEMARNRVSAFVFYDDTKTPEGYRDAKSYAMDLIEGELRSRAADITAFWTRVNRCLDRVDVIDNLTHHSKELGISEEEAAKGIAALFG